MREVLVVVVGATPQVLTELVWWLLQRAEPVRVPEEVHVVTTATGKRRLEEDVLGAAGVLARLCRECAAPYPALTVHVAPDERGMVAEDIRTAATHGELATFLMELVRRLTMPTDTRLLACISGGRKTMSLYLGLAMTLFGRPQDSTVHVLVAPEFERLAGFWYPPASPEQLAAPDGRQLDTGAADVSVIDVPFPRLRGTLAPSTLRQGILDLRATLADATLPRDASLPPITLRLAGALADAEAASPLAPFMSMMSPEDRLVLRYRHICREGELPKLDVLVEVRRPGWLPEHREELRANIMQALAPARARHLFSEVDPVPAPDWNWHAEIAATGFELPAATGVSLASQQARTVTLGLGLDKQPEVASAITALRELDHDAELVLECEAFRLDGEDRGALARARQYVRGLATNAGTVENVQRAGLGEAILMRIADELDAWTLSGGGYRVRARIGAAAEPTSVSLGLVARGVFRARGVRILRSATSERASASAGLDLASAYHGPQAVPLDLPSGALLLQAGIPRTYAVPQQQLPTTGPRLGHAGDMAVRIAEADRTRHMYVIGATGTGKSTLLRNLALQDIEAGHGTCVIDPHGDLHADLLANIPTSRREDVVVIDAADTAYPVGLNLLHVSTGDVELEAGIVANGLLSMFQELYRGSPESMGPWFEQAFRMSTQLLIGHPGGPWTAVDLLRFWTDRKFRREIVAGATSPSLRMAAEMQMASSGDQSLENFAPYITNKLNAFTLNTHARNILCQRSAALDFRAMLDTRAIVLVNLAKGLIGDLNARLLGMFVLERLHRAAMSRANVPAAQRTTMHVYVDEFQAVAADALRDMLAEGRKYGIALVLAHQNLEQVSRTLQQAVLGNTGSFAFFRQGVDDAERLAPHVGPAHDSAALRELPNHAAIVRLSNLGKPLIPFTLATDPPRAASGTTCSAARVLEISRLKYASPRARVEESFRVHLERPSE